MTDRVQGFVVTLDRDMRIDDAQALIDAIKMLRHVMSVKPSIVTADDFFARQRIAIELQNKVLQVFLDEAHEQR